jgi:membrane associated rhomboid family serine protease
MIPLRDINPTRSTPVATYTLLVTNVAVFLYQVSLGPGAGEAFVMRFGMIPYYLTDSVHLPSFTTPLTSMFLHGGWLHLIFNVWFLHVFGDNVEDALGKTRFVAFYVATGLAAALAQTLVDPGSRVPMVGASGAISGVLGAYVRMYPGARVVTLIPFFVLMLIRHVPAGFFIAFWFIGQLVSGMGSLGRSSGGGIAFFAHIGGFVAGLLLLGLFRGRRRPASAR